ncbi:ferritin-like domain-containing protein [Halorussus halophilus]|uniref:ferritin-like domain-containing protein n=1 Tax=Halorussus halophilus TaxID=2650975 RepID=UPI001CE494F3|nr:ferritin-like domain-containing protein [Halorussus halophilus]
MVDRTQSDDDAAASIEAITESAQEQLTSRRGFLAGSATALGAVGVSGTAMGQLAGGQTDKSGAPAAQDEDGAEKSDETSDIDILNYALTLEHLEATFYQQGVEEFDAEEFRDANLGCDVPDATREQIPMWVETVGEHEAAHVEQITKVIEKLGGDPVEAAEYDFGYESPAEFLGVAKALENTGVAAYAGAAPSIESDKLLAAAVSIHSVEARHAASLNYVNDASPFPNAFDEAKSMEKVKEIASQFIVKS